MSPLIFGGIVGPLGRFKAKHLEPAGRFEILLGPFRRNPGKRGYRAVQIVSARIVHEIDAPWPHFLELLDTDPRRALEGLHVFAWKLFESRPPAIMRKLDPAERQDRIADLVLSCCRDDFRKIRSYRDVGKPFSAWLGIVLCRQVLDWMRTQRPVIELRDAIGAIEPAPQPGISDRVLGCLNRCLGQMTEKCRLYLACFAEGMKPKEVALLLRLPPGDNKRVSDDLRHCLNRLRAMLVSEGIDLEEVGP